MITIRVLVEELPIYVKEKDIDMKCIFYNKIYRKKIEIFNRSKSACKINIKIPYIFSKYIEISPLMVIIPGESSQSVNIKIMPVLNILKKIAYFSILNEEFLNCALFNLPIEIRVILFYYLYCFYCF